ncbi:ABC transporter ATP-binding protein [Streptomyces sp. NPDC006237]|uniref:ABC transporter ATP-binding protein n=1 Tax=unclassified Streptomyces TaxID=2593676 RepID=UPI0033A319C7
MSSKLRKRKRLGECLIDAGLPLVSGLALVQITTSVVPAVTAIVVAALVKNVAETAVTDLTATAVAPLAALTAVLLVSHVAEAFSRPLFYKARARINGVHRTRVARVISMSHTMEVLEDPEVQKLVETAKADPRNWTERTPGDGALEQLRIVTAAVGVVASCAVLWHYAWWFVPALLIPALLDATARSRQANRIVEQWRDRTDHGLHASTWERALTTPEEGKDIQVFGLAEVVIGRIRQYTLAMFEPLWQRQGALLKYVRIQFFLVAAPLAAVYAVVAHIVVDDGASIAAATAVLAAGWSVFQATQVVDPRNFHGAVETLDAFEEIRLRLNDGTGDREAAEEWRWENRQPPLVRFEGVGFTYPRGARPVLEGLDLEIRPGELLAIVGLNGAGKSTLIKLLAGLYRPSSGRITVDGTDVAAIGVDRWRRYLSVVFQDFVRYPLSAAANVTLGRPRDGADLEAAAAEAGLLNVVARLPQGWDTPLTRTHAGGVDLSGGQWQQVALTRALYAVRTGARVLVLDEPTAHLDVRTEFDVFRRLAARTTEASVVLISHRLSTVRQADRIVLLADGRVAESGSHDELMALGGQYAEMFTIQAERFHQDWEDATVAQRELS